MIASPRRQPIPDPSEPLRLDLVNRKDATARQIKAYILEHGLEPGDPLPGEQELCGELGVSRSSVREALRRLEALDIVQVRQGRGSFVGTLSMAPLYEAMTFRTMLDSQDDLQTLRKLVKMRRYLDLGAAEKICFELKGKTLPELEELVEEMTRKAGRGEVFTQEDFAFHDGIMALIDNEFVRELVNTFWEVHTAVLPRLNLGGSGTSLEPTARAHGDMLRAACAGDVEAYRQAVREHYKPLETVLGD